jgi:hypothetical protein
VLSRLGKRRRRRGLCATPAPKPPQGYGHPPQGCNWLRLPAACHDAAPASPRVNHPPPPTHPPPRCGRRLQSAARRIPDPMPHPPRPPWHRHPSPTTQHLCAGWSCPHAPAPSCQEPRLQLCLASRTARAGPALGGSLTRSPARASCERTVLGVCHRRGGAPAGCDGQGAVADPKAKDVMLQRPAARALQPRRPRKNHGACTQGASASLPGSNRAPLRPPCV